MINKKVKFSPKNYGENQKILCYYFEVLKRSNTLNVMSKAESA